MNMPTLTRRVTTSITPIERRSFLKQRAVIGSTELPRSIKINAGVYFPDIKLKTSHSIGSWAYQVVWTSTK